MEDVNYQRGWVDVDNIADEIEERTDFDEKIDAATQQAAAMAELARARADDIPAFAGFRDAADLTTLLANSTWRYDATGAAQVVAGDVFRTRKEGFSYVAAASGASDHHLTTAGGLKVYVRPDKEGRSLIAFGCVGDGVTDDSAKFSTAVATGRCYIPEGYVVKVTTRTLGAVLDISGPGALLVSSGNMFVTGEDMTTFRIDGARLIGNASGDLLAFSHNIDSFSVAGCEISGFDRMTDAGSSSLEVASITISDNYTHDCRSGFEFKINRIGQATATGNTFNDIVRSSSNFGFCFGSNTTVDTDLRGNYVVSANNFKNIINTGIGEAHAILCYGKRASVTGNVVDTVTNTDVQGAEAIYTKVRFATITGNSIKNGGWSTNGAIAVKGATRDQSDAPHGYGVTVTGNAVQFTGSGSNGIGIFIANEQVVCVGNHVEGANLAGIQVVCGDNGEGINVSSNIVYGAVCANPIWITSGGTDFSIVGNQVIAWLPTSAGAGIRIDPPNYTTMKGIKIADNQVRCVDNDVVAYGIGVWVSDLDNILEDVDVSNNQIDMTAGSATRGIALVSNSAATYRNVSVTDNRVRATSEQFRTGSTVTFEGECDFGKNRFSGQVKTTSGAAPNLTQSNCDQPIIWAVSGVDGVHRLPAAIIGFRFKVVKATSDANTCGFSRLGSDTFRGGATSAVIGALGFLEVACHEAGVWDVVGSSGAVTFA